MQSFFCFVQNSVCKESPVTWFGEGQQTTDRSWYNHRRCLVTVPWWRVFTGLAMLASSKKLRNPEYTSRNPESHQRFQYLESGIHFVESRIQDCLGLPYMGRQCASLTAHSKVGGREKLSFIFVRQFFWPIRLWVEHIIFFFILKRMLKRGWPTHRKHPEWMWTWAELFHLCPTASYCDFSM